jgi:predicted dehydrogenase
MLKYGFEHGDDRIRAGFVGCGGHAFRNVYPALRYAPIDLVAVCDIQISRAEAYARDFGGQRVYDDHQKMLAAEELDAVFVVTNYDENSLPRFPAIAIDAMQAGAHAWIEKPPAGSVAEIDNMMAVERETGKFVQVGMKKMFFPTISKLHAISQDDAFGGLTSLSVRYPQHMPDADRRDDNRAMVGFLDHIMHPGAIIHLLAGPVKTLYYERSRNGASVSVMTFNDGVTGTMHLTAGQSGTSPLERVEIVGSGANAIADNGVKLTYYRPGTRGEGGYGRSPNFIGADDGAPIYWEPEFSLGQLYNKGLFLIGYAPEVIYFADCVRENRAPEKAGLTDARAITKLYEAYRYGEAGTVIQVHP